MFSEVNPTTKIFCIKTRNNYKELHLIEKDKLKNTYWGEPLQSLASAFTTAAVLL
jgi:hypothetical protein